MRNKTYMTAIELAAKLGVSKCILSNWVKMGCPYIVLNPLAKNTGRRFRFNPDEVMAWVKANLCEDGKGVSHE